MPVWGGLRLARGISQNCRTQTKSLKDLCRTTTALLRPIPFSPGVARIRDHFSVAVALQQTEEELAKRVLVCV